jgi:hypothetical protein
MPVCMRSKSSLSRGSCLSTCSQMRSASEDSEPAYHCEPLVDGVMPSASGCSNVPCTQCLQGRQQTPSPECCTHLLHTVLIVWHPCQHVVAVFSQQHTCRGHSKAQPASLCCTLYEQHTHAAHTQTHACMLSFCSRFRATQMRLRRVPPS